MIEARAVGSDVVGHDHVRGFCGELLPGVFSDVIGLGGESRDNAIALDAGDVSQNIECWLEFEDQPFPAALDLLVLRSSGPVIGHGGGHDDDRGGGQVRHHRAMHRRGSAHRDSLDVRRRFERRGAAHEHYASAAPRRRAGQCVAHLARRTVRQVANRVEVLARGAGGNQHGLTRDGRGGCQALPQPRRQWLRSPASRPAPVMPQAR